MTSAGAASYPTGPAQRSAWIAALRPARNRPDAFLPYAQAWEEEASKDGEPISTAVLFLTNRECPFRCLMCDLWKNTLVRQTPPGAIPAQIAAGLAALEPARRVKLYNAGSFFDPGAIPFDDHPAIAALLAGFERVVVECHPAFLNETCLRFNDLIQGRLEVAVGLETAHPGVLERLNKRMTLADFERAAGFLQSARIPLRTFILVRPPFLSEPEGLDWACRSLDFAFDQGAETCTLIPVRAGNGAMEALAAAGDFEPPSLATLEEALAYGLQLRRGRVFADMWDVNLLARCRCAPGRMERIAHMNRTQRAAGTAEECVFCR